MKSFKLAVLLCGFALPALGDEPLAVEVPRDQFGLRRHEFPAVTPDPRPGTPMYPASSCTGPVVAGQCHGAIVPVEPNPVRCYGAVLPDGSCTGPRF